LLGNVHSGGGAAALPLVVLRGLKGGFGLLAAFLCVNEGLHRVGAPFGVPARNLGELCDLSATFG